MDGEEYCNTGLALSIGGGGDLSSNKNHDRKPPVQFHILFPLQLNEEEKEETASTAEFDHKKNTSRSSSDNDENYCIIANSMREGSSNRDGTRKKLRLTREQSMLLEDSFKTHKTLTSVRKQQLAQLLDLRPRQVEVWFQNRRARNKLKQTEVDRELLKEKCESLVNENRKLKVELMELRSWLKPGSPFYVQLSKAATLSMCPSCKKMVTNN